MDRKAHKTLAFALNKKNWRDADLLFCFFTKDFGRIEAVAAGARKIQSKLAGHLSSAGIIEIIFIEGRARKKLTHGYLVKQYRMDGGGDWYYYCLQELLLKSLPIGEKNDLIWRLMIWALENIQKQKTEDGKKMVLNLFVVKLLACLGYAIRSKPLGGTAARFTLPVEVKQMVENINHGQGKLMIGASRKDIKKMLFFLQQYLTYCLEKPIYSLEYVARLRS